MRNKFDSIGCIKEIINCSPRQLEGEKCAAKVIRNILKEHNLIFFEQKFSLNIPRMKSSELIVDGIKLKNVQGCSFVGGKINGKENIISSLIPSAQFINKANINFNPACKSISAGNHYFAPAIAVSHNDLKKIIRGKNVNGIVEVERIKHETCNILVGNRKNPKNICFAHYDSINMGAIDNASGVALIFSVIISKNELLNDTLFVFSAAEELSYDKPIYWGYGFRIFEKKYLNIMQNAKKILVIDCVGHAKATILTEEKFLKLGFPIANIKQLSKKTKLITADYEKLMTVYHSNIDDGRMITKKYMHNSFEVLINQIEK